MNKPLHLHIDTDFQVSQDYLIALGQVHYYFAQLQWVAIHILCRLSGEDLRTQTVPSDTIRKKLENAINTANPALSENLKTKLLAFTAQFEAAVSSSNKLIRTHPAAYPEPPTWILQHGSSTQWSLGTLNHVFMNHIRAAKEGEELFYGPLAQERP